jgi:hypothetical protein
MNPIGKGEGAPGLIYILIFFKMDIYVLCQMRMNRYTVQLEEPDKEIVTITGLALA